jgi:hypothetical protein
MEALHGRARIEVVPKAVAYVEYFAALDTDGSMLTDGPFVFDEVV